MKYYQFQESMHPYPCHMKAETQLRSFTQGILKKLLDRRIQFKDLTDNQLLDYQSGLAFYYEGYLYQHKDMLAGEIQRRGSIKIRNHVQLQHLSKEKIKKKNKAYQNVLPEILQVEENKSVPLVKKEILNVQASIPTQQSSKDISQTVGTSQNTSGPQPQKMGRLKIDQSKDKQDKESEQKQNQSLSNSESLSFDDKFIKNFKKEMKSMRNSQKRLNQRQDSKLDMSKMSNTDSLDSLSHFGSQNSRIQKNLKKILNSKEITDKVYNFKPSEPQPQEKKQLRKQHSQQGVIDSKKNIKIENESTQVKFNQKNKPETKPKKKRNYHPYTLTCISNDGETKFLSEGDVQKLCRHHNINFEYFKEPTTIPKQQINSFKSLLEKGKNSQRWQNIAARLLNKCWRAPGAKWFHQKVDSELLGIQDYYQVITRPMDFSTIKKKLQYNYYSSPEVFKIDMMLVFNNCYKYNGRGHSLSKIALKIEEKFIKQYEAQIHKKFSQ